MVLTKAQRVVHFSGYAVYQALRFIFISSLS
jgi:hypothetical protein